MKIFYFILLVFFPIVVFSQNMLLVERPGTVKNEKYYAGQAISIKTIDGLKISGPINIIRDSNMIIDFTHEIAITDIEIVYKRRTLVSLLSSILITGSALWIGLDLINGGSQGKSFSENQSLQLGLGLIATGIGLRFIRDKRMNVKKEKWRIRVLKEIK
ncbi:MAG: hypothetical protein KAH25_05365 [Bacteroidales bacterium]|nr:hypothetical protein [Bacteroidales bacterium]